MKILISTPLLQSDIGGPASYAFHLEKYLKQKGHQVTIVSFAFEKKKYHQDSGIFFIFLGYLPVRCLQIMLLP